MPLSNRNRKFLKKLIAAEENHRKPHEKALELVKNRVILKKMEEMGANIVITNALGEKGKTQVGLDEFTIEEMNAKVESIENGIKVSRAKEKFLRYAYNGDIEKAKKTHTKLMEMWMKNHEILEEAEKSGEHTSFMIDHSGINGGKGDIIHRDGGAYIEHAKQMKVAYDWRVEILEYMESP